MLRFERPLVLMVQKLEGSGQYGASIRISATQDIYIYLKTLNLGKKNHKTLVVSIP